MKNTLKMSKDNRQFGRSLAAILEKEEAERKRFCVKLSDNEIQVLEEKSIENKTDIERLIKQAIDEKFFRKKAI